MECSIDVDSDGERASCGSSYIRKARKEHKCDECRRTITKGEQYEVVTGRWSDRFDRYKTCADCLSIRKMFFSSWTIGSILDDIAYQIVEEWNGDVPEKCIIGLTPKAKDKIFALIEKTYGDDDENA